MTLFYRAITPLIFLADFRWLSAPLCVFICEYLRIQSALICVRCIFFFLANLRWFFSTNNANPLRISAWNTFSEFSPRHPNIPQNNSPLKIRGVPPKAGRCYDVRNEELEKWELRMRPSAFSICEYLRELFFRNFFSLIYADFLCAHLRFQSANICVRCIFSFSPINIRNGFRWSSSHQAKYRGSTYNASPKDSVLLSPHRLQKDIRG